MFPKLANHLFENQNLFPEKVFSVRLAFLVIFIGSPLEFMCKNLTGLTVFQCKCILIDFQVLFAFFKSAEFLNR